MHTCILIIQLSMLISSDRKLRRGDETAKSIYSGKDAPPIDIYKSKQSKSLYYGA